MLPGLGFVPLPAAATPWAAALFGSNLRDWYAANDAASVTLASGAVSAWADKGPAGRNLAQATAASRPTVSAGAFPTGRDGIRFASASAQHLLVNDAGLLADFGGVLPCTFACAFISASSNASQAVWDLGAPGSAAGNDRYGLFTFTSASVFARRGNGVNINFPVGITTGTRMVVVMRSDGTNLYVDAKYQLGGTGTVTTWSASTLANSSLASLSRLTLGGRFKDGEAAPSLPADCTIGEYLTVNRYSTDTETASLRDRLWTDWFNV
ncbi:hypothetical protein M0638_08570 [Roseomonas sp. NAR14]|uniref:Concanavalin A-like lectin/glucanase superfamily protein n=1 Tax=Roseomonas acroporae TaxID=2937791 RepID=A0A9X1Y6I9_9PROT|nr:hypothetical protein [Roseomonas acroporae]MCK8784431.1 hypothetical protein [Roseomonas acroporae]